MRADYRSDRDTYELIVDKLSHIYTIGCLLVDTGEQPALGAGDLVLELAKEAESLFEQYSSTLKGGAS